MEITVISNDDIGGYVTPEYPIGRPAIKEVGEYFTVSAYSNEGYYFSHWRYEVGNQVIISSSQTISLQIPGLPDDDKQELNFVAYFRELTDLTSDKGIRLRMKNNDEEREFDFGTITSIGLVYNSSVNVDAIMTFSFESSLCYDMGVGKTYEISFTRVNPTDIDNTDTLDTSKWSNKKWIKEVKNFINRWQGMHNGFRMSIVPEHSDEYPTIIDNVYFTSLSLPKTNTTSQVISGDMQITVGTLYISASTPIPNAKIKLSNNFERMGWGEDEITEYTRPVGLNFNLYVPELWYSTAISKTCSCIGWDTDKDFKPTPSKPMPMYPPSGRFEVEEDITLYAIWAKYDSFILVTDTEREVVIGSDQLSEYSGIDIYAIGGGGGGGSTDYEEYFYSVRYCGGGGGSGASIIYHYTWQPGEEVELRCKIGKGGSRDNDGGTTSFTLSRSGDMIQRICDGGKAGGRRRNGGAGGSGDGNPGSANGFSGGRGGQIRFDYVWSYEGGVKGDGSKPGNPGDNSDYSGALGDSKHWRSGGGGAGSDENIVNAYKLFTSSDDVKGGNGTSDGNAGAGKLGCGGGGAGWRTELFIEQFWSDGQGTANSGGDGFILVVRYR